MLVEYRTIEGEVIRHTIDDARGVTISDIDAIALQYFEKTNREPTEVFLRIDVYDRILKDMATSMRGHAMGQGPQRMSLWLSLGQAQVRAINGAYIPVLVGSEEEYKDNDWYEIFERVALGQ